MSSLMQSLSYRLHWVTTFSGQWPSLSHVSLPNMHEFGVYVIWVPGRLKPAIRVGQGFIAERLTSHRRNPMIVSHGRPFLHVTWAQAPQNMTDGIERYLGDTLRPIESERFPDCTPIPVNLPIA
jgi:hypothetical protein